MKKILILIISFLIITTAYPSPTNAVCPDQIQIVNCGWCGGKNGTDCVAITATECACRQPLPDPDNPFGPIINPLPWRSNQPGGGLIMLLNNLLKLVFVVAGIFTFIRILLAGFKFISAGADPKKISEAQNSIWQSLLGLIIIISSLVVAGLIGLILFGDWTAILSPKIYGPTQ